MKWNEDDGIIGEAHKIDGLFQPFDRDNKGFSFYIGFGVIKWVYNFIKRGIRYELGKKIISKVRSKGHTKANKRFY